MGSTLGDDHDAADRGRAFRELEQGHTHGTIVLVP
jgi:hypothetical protein